MEVEMRNCRYAAVAINNEVDNQREQVEKASFRELKTKKETKEKNTREATIGLYPGLPVARIRERLSDSRIFRTSHDGSDAEPCRRLRLPGRMNGKSDGRKRGKRARRGRRCCECDDGRTRRESGGRSGKCGIKEERRNGCQKEAAGRGMERAVGGGRCAKEEKERSLGGRRRGRIRGGKSGAVWGPNSDDARHLNQWCGPTLSTDGKCRPGRFGGFSGRRK
ncbi:uncharacterized protein SPSK_09779 [Sporothrix schenckii 1099-18]|uniref:Uncharacterized protein n=1 Tax=Sporothrix schenckii 1099-18 TaxID=1397361 RepID=A0A0F2MAR2_SPOSC|nr:uncharacterized protein SPSK_09779 [Sporothrix schenckii 1099-18]KJR85915.1 hypothetical protein SPSK_09779 [Sporothrix schenckii 1099-18]